MRPLEEGRGNERRLDADGMLTHGNIVMAPCMCLCMCIRDSMLNLILSRLRIYRSTLLARSY